MAKEITFETLVEHLEVLEDPRSTVNKKHPLVNVIFTAICAAISGAKMWTEVEIFAKGRTEWLAKYVDLKHGIPSHDTFGRVFRLLDPDAFSSMFHDWIELVMGKVGPQVVAIDGKTNRRSGDRTLGRAALHMVSAWATEDHVVLGQVKTKEKSNEITAIPILLDRFDVKGSIVTMDAMGCQKEIVKTIIQKDADYVIGLKGNQESLLNRALELFEEIPTEKEVRKAKKAQHETKEKGHGRVERREYTMMEDKTLSTSHPDWPGMRSFVQVVAHRSIEDKTTTETRYYATSLPCNVKTAAHAIRQHWGVENSLHWTLDMAFREDESRVRKDHAPENLAVLSRMTLSLLKNERTDKHGIQGKRFRAAVEPDYLEKVLCTPRS